MSLDEHNSLKHYYKQMDECTLLPNEFVIELIRKAHKGCEVSRNRVIKHNLRLVVKLAIRSRTAIELEDRIQYGNLGLMHAVEKYDPDLMNPQNNMPYAFSTYATWWIKQCMDREAMNTQSTIRIPIHVLKSYGKVRKVQNYLYKLGILIPKYEDYAEYFNEDFTEKDLRSYERMPYVYSENAEHMDEDGEYSAFDSVTDEDALPVEDSLDNDSLKKYILEHLDILNEKQRSVLVMRFGLNGDEPATLEDCGVRIGLTRERVRQLQVLALKRLKDSFRANNLTKESVL